MLVTSITVGLFIAVVNVALIEVGIHHYGSTQLGSSIALTAFILMLVVAAYECRSETASILTGDTFNSSKMNWIALAEVAGAVLLTQADFMQRVLGSTALNAQQWGLALLAAVALLIVWETGKWLGRR